MPKTPRWSAVGSSTFFEKTGERPVRPRHRSRHDGIEGRHRVDHRRDRVDVRRPTHDPLAPEGRRRAGRRRVVAPHHRRVPRGLGRGRRRSAKGRGREHHRSVGEHGARRRPRRSGRALHPLDGHARRPPRAQAHRRQGVGLQGEGHRHVDPSHRRRALDRGRRPDRAHAAPRHRSARHRERRALVPRAGRLHRHALHRRSDRHARVDDRRVAHRQPRPHHARLRRQAARARRRRRVEAAAAAHDRVGHRHRARRGGRRPRPTARCAGHRRHPRSAQRVGWCRHRPRLPDAHGDQHHDVDQLPGVVQEDRRHESDRVGPGRGPRGLPARQQPRHVGRACSGCATR